MSIASLKKLLLPSLICLICLILTGVTTWAQTTLTVTRPAGFAVSPRLTDIQDSDVPQAPVTHPHHPLPDRGRAQGAGDAALQTSVGDLMKARPHARFPGVGANGYAPPDTNIAVGPSHIVETVNVRYAVYDKNGSLLLGPKTLSSIWAALGGDCGSKNGGDPVVQYDKLADRWIITQLGSTSGPFSQCIAVSKTGDPTGAYSLYSYPYGSTLNDYPKFGVWPTATSSAYLATYNLFANGANFAGGQLCAYDRAAMLSGAPSPASICYTISNDGGFLPSDLDGPTAPLDGTPAYFLTFETLSSLRMYTLAPNFANPGASVLQQVSPDLTVAGFSEACGGGACIPQSGTNTQLDSLGDRLMYRLAFRIFPDHEAMVVNHSVTAGASVGVRWYELRGPVSAGATFGVFQQGTFAPDSTYRWMASAAMDKAGDIAIGYSASSSSIHPSIRYTGRTPGDPPNTMATESSMLEGAGSQTSGLTRWGDYTALRIDPSDDCTFWYSNEYLPANGSFNWSTFIGSFQFPGCAGPPIPDYSLSANPSSLTLTQGQQGTSTITVTSLNGFNSAVGLTVSGCPSGAGCSLLPTSVTPPPNGSATSTLTVTTSAATQTGTFTLTISGGAHSTTVTLTVKAPTPDFTLSTSTNTLTVNRGSSNSLTVNVGQVNGSSSVTLSLSGLPRRTSANFNPNPVTTSGSSTLTISATPKAPTGSYLLTITGQNANNTHTTQITLIIN